MLEGISGGQVILIVINLLLCIVGFVISLMIKRLYQSVDLLVKKDDAIQLQVNTHREDTLRNFSRTEELKNLREEVFKRMDRMEDSIMRAIRNIPGHTPP